MNEALSAKIINMVINGPNKDRKVHLKFKYTNHRGETSKRHVIFSHMEVTTTEWHGHGLHMFAYDVKKKDMRAFNVDDMDVENIQIEIEQG